MDSIAFFQDFGDGCTTHGIKYILEKDQPILDRLLWLAIVISGVIQLFWADATRSYCQIIDIYDFVIGNYGETLTVNNYNYLENCYHEVKVIAKGIFLSFPISICIRNQIRVSD